MKKIIKSAILTAICFSPVIANPYDLPPDLEGMEQISEKREALKEKIESLLVRGDEDELKSSIRFLLLDLGTRASEGILEYQDFFDHVVHRLLTTGKAPLARWIRDTYFGIVFYNLPEGYCFKKPLLMEKFFKMQLAGVRWLESLERNGHEPIVDKRLRQLFELGSTKAAIQLVSRYEEQYKPELLKPREHRQIAAKRLRYLISLGREAFRYLELLSAPGFKDKSRDLMQQKLKELEKSFKGLILELRQSSLVPSDILGESVSDEELFQEFSRFKDRATEISEANGLDFSIE
jgi:hypothetical protein